MSEHAAIPLRPPGQRRAEALAEAHRLTVELLANDAPLGAALDCLCRAVEAQLPEAVCSVLLLDPDGVRVRDGGGPSLPPAFRKAVDGQPSGPAAGSCGTAIYRRQAVIVEDIAQDPLWADYREAARAAGFAASTSTPIFDGSGRVLGTFAIYHREAGPFSAEELEILRDMNHLAALAISRDQRMAALKERMDQLAMAERLAHLGFWTWHVTNNRVEWSEGLYRIYGLDRSAFGASLQGYLERVHP